MPTDVRAFVTSRLAGFLFETWQRGAKGKPPPDDQDASDLLGAITALTVPDRAAALRDVETLLRDMHVSAGPDGRLRDRLWLTDDSPMSTRSIADLAALIVNRVLGAEQDGEKP